MVRPSAKRHAGGAAAGDLDVLHVGAGDDLAAAGLDDARERKRQRHRAADRQREARDIGEDGGKHDAGAGHVLGRDHVHIRREQRADALVDEMLAHDAEEVVLRVREQLFCLGAAQPVDELLARHRRVVEQRHQQRPHLLAIGMPERPEGLGVLLRKAGERRAGLVEILVDDDAGAVAEDRRLLHRRLDIREAETMKLEIIQQRAEPHPHEEIGVQIELEPGENALFGARAAADPAVALEHGDTQTGAGKIGGERQAVVTGSDNDAVEIRHGAPARPLCIQTSVAAQIHANNGHAERLRRACQSKHAMIE